GNVDAANSCRTGIIRQRQAGADTDIEHAPADAVGFGNGRLPAGVEHFAEYKVVDRRPPPIRLFDPFAVDVPHAPPRNSYLTASANGRVAPLCRAAALWMKPPPSTRAWPDGAS